MGLLTIDSRLDGLDEDDIDPDYSPHPHVSISNEGAMLASSTRIDDVISGLLYLADESRYSLKGSICFHHRIRKTRLV